MAYGSWPGPIQSDRIRAYFGYTDMGLAMRALVCPSSAPVLGFAKLRAPFSCIS